MPEANLVITLNPPIKFDGGEIAPLHLREPTGADMHAAEKQIANGVTPETISAYQVTLLAGVTGLKPEAMDLLRVSDLRRGFSYLQAFDALVPEAVVGEPATLTLTIPSEVTVGGVAYKAITLREPTVGERRRAETALRPDSNPATRRAYQMILVAAASDVPYAAISALPVSVLNAAEAFLRGFIDGGRTTGSA